jgi:thioredoxin-like negative regulator of GroEL
VDLDNYESEIIKERRPVLLACLLKNYEFTNQIEVLKTVGEVYRRMLNVCLMDEKDSDAFMKRFHIEGTPTYLLLERGRVKDGLLGVTNSETLRSFIIKNYPNFSEIEK